MTKHRESTPAAVDHRISVRVAPGEGPILVGDKNSMRAWIEFNYSEIGLEKQLCLHQFGTLPADRNRANLERFARDVMPHLRPLKGAPAAIPTVEAAVQAAA